MCEANQDTCLNTRKKVNGIIKFWTMLLTESLQTDNSRMKPQVSFARHFENSPKSYHLHLYIVP